MSDKQKLYPPVSSIELDEDGNYFMRHMMAMTSEDLHMKADIAAQLGARDREIDQLRQSLEAGKAVSGWRPSQELLNLLCAVGYVGVPIGDYGQPYELSKDEIETAQRLYHELNQPPPPSGNGRE